MKLHLKVGLMVLGVAALALTSGILAQKVVKIRLGGGNSPSSGEESRSDVPGENAPVEPIDPTPEEHKQIANLIEELGAPTLPRRDLAMSELAAFEAVALGQVREGMDHDNDEIANRCSILEEVILSRQGEYFLAARRLNLSINELKNLIQSDVPGLLSILKERAQPGMVSLWARILAQLSTRSQLFPTAEVCIDIEGAKGYGQALARACESLETSENSENLRMLMLLHPPGDPGDVVEALTQLRFGKEGEIADALEAAYELRGVYDAASALESKRGAPGVGGKQHEGVAEVRTALALSMVETCTVEELNAAGLPPFTEMTPLLMQAWLSLAARSGLNEEIVSKVNALIAAKPDLRRLSIGAAARARVSPINEVIARFDNLPLGAQLSVLDSLWLRPREPLTLQPFLIRLLSNDSQALRLAGVRGLAQLRARSTVEALVNTALNDPPVAAASLHALIPMSDLLNPGELKSLSAKLPAAGLVQRQWLVEILVATGQTQALKPLIDEWRVALPRNELPLAFTVLSADATAPAGAYAAGYMKAFLNADWSRDRLRLILKGADLELIRTLIAMDAEDGFALLEELANDAEGRERITAMAALALSNRDGELIDDWLKRMAGEIKDSDAKDIGYAVALSTTPEAEEFRRNALQQGADSPNLRWVHLAYTAGTTQITRDELLDVLFETPKSATRWVKSPGLLDGPLSPKVAENIATALAFDNSSAYSDPGRALRLMEMNVDMLGVLYPKTDEPKPRDSHELYVVSLFVEPQRALEVLNRAEVIKDGSNYVSLMIARAWANPTESRQKRIAGMVATNPTSTFGVIRRLQDAGQGDAEALFELLDTFGPDRARFRPGQTAEAKMTERWGNFYLNWGGVGFAAVSAEKDGDDIESDQFGELFKSPPPKDWREWWSCRRGLVEYDNESGKFILVELP